jgi:hypothetical protein
MCCSRSNCSCIQNLHQRMPAILTHSCHRCSQTCRHSRCRWTWLSAGWCHFDSEAHRLWLFDKNHIHIATVRLIRYRSLAIQSIHNSHLRCHLRMRTLYFRSNSKCTVRESPYQYKVYLQDCSTGPCSRWSCLPMADWSCPERIRHCCSELRFRNPCNLKCCIHPVISIHFGPRKLFLLLLSIFACHLPCRFCTAIACTFRS